MGFWNLRLGVRGISADGCLFWLSAVMLRKRWCLEQSKKVPGFFYLLLLDFLDPCGDYTGA